MVVIRGLFVVGLIAFSVYEIVQLVHIIKERKKEKNAKSEKEIVNTDDRNSNS